MYLLKEASLCHRPLTQRFLGKRCYMENPVKPRRYFVRHLTEGDERRAKGQVYQIQLVDKYGRATGFVYLSAHDTEAAIGDDVVPEKVIVAVRSFPAGTGDFVDEEGHRLAPKDLLS